MSATGISISTNQPAPRSFRLFLSHSTGDLRDTALAHGIANGLIARNVPVWIAPEKLPAGSQWAEEIVAAVLNECSEFLVILSAASVSSEWVLKEIELALRRRSADPEFRILPLIVGRLGDYRWRTQIKQIQSLPYHDSLVAQVGAIARVLGTSSGTPGRERLTGEFVGREFVFRAIDEFLRSHHQGCFTIVGDPGEGKTTILSEYVRRTGCVAYFNVMNEQVSRPEEFLASIDGQISARYNLTPSPYSADSVEWSSRLHEKLEHAARRLRPEERLVIAIDALDEVDMTRYPAGTNILFLPRNLPERTFLIMTRRRGAIPFVNKSTQAVFDLLEHQSECMDDVRRYVRSRLDSGVLDRWGRPQGLGYEETVERLAEKSERNFMYLFYVLPEIESGAYRNLDMNQIPVGLQGFYEDHWTRMGMKARPLPSDKIRIVYVLAELRRPVSRRLIACFARQDPLFVQSVLDEWDQFLHRRAGDDDVLYTIYHTSFLDFLHRKVIVQAAGESIKGIHDIIQDQLWAELMRGEPPLRGSRPEGES